MKKITLFFSMTVMLLAVVMMACNNEKAKTVEITETIVKPAAPLPYTARYSSSFEIGNPTYVAPLLQGEWKAWEENKIDNIKAWAADTVLAIFSDNTVVRGADSLAAIMKRYRATLTSVIDTIDAVVPLYSTDKKENWVLIAATEIFTKPNGVKDTVAFMENWRLNRDGKADLLLQFDRAKRKQ